MLFIGGNFVAPVSLPLLALWASPASFALLVGVAGATAKQHH